MNIYNNLPFKQQKMDIKNHSVDMHLQLVQEAHINYTDYQH